jgi:uncharacterized membrane protein YkvA (DUF1232 family)
MSSDNTADWRAGEDAHQDVRQKFWRKLRQVARRIPFTEDLLAAYYCAFDRATPHHVRASLIGALAYFILPFDVLPDMMLALGFTDDMAVLAGVLRLVTSHIKPEHRDAARDALARGLPGE